MRWSPKLVFAAGVGISALALGCSTGETTMPTDHHAILLERNQESALTRFTSAVFPFELKITAQDTACHGAGVFVNGLELTHTWNGSFGHGSGEIPSFPPENEGEIMSANWQSICVPPPPASKNNRTVQLLGVRIMSTGKLSLGGVNGFTASFSQLARPEILMLYPEWEGITPGYPYTENWREPEETELLENHQLAEIYNDVVFRTDVERHWKQLRDLRTHVDDLKQQIKGEEHEILKSLQQACPCLAAKWENCTSIPSAFELSLQKASELFCQLRYGFGPFPSSLPKAALTVLENGDCEIPPQTHPAMTLLVGAVIVFVFLIYRKVKRHERRRV